MTEYHLWVQVPLLGKKVWTRAEWGGQYQLKNSEVMSSQDLWFSLGGKYLSSASGLNITTFIFSEIPPESRWKTSPTVRVSAGLPWSLVHVRREKDPRPKV